MAGLILPLTRAEEVEAARIRDVKNWPLGPILPMKSRSLKDESGALKLGFMVAGDRQLRVYEGDIYELDATLRKGEDAIVKYLEETPQHKYSSLDSLVKFWVGD